MFLYAFEFRSVSGRHYTKNEMPEGQNSQRARISRSDLTNCVNLLSALVFVAAFVSFKYYIVTVFLPNKCHF